MSTKWSATRTFLACRSACVVTYLSCLLLPPSRNNYVVIYYLNHNGFSTNFETLTTRANIFPRATHAWAMGYLGSPKQCTEEVMTNGCNAGRHSLQHKELICGH